MEITEVRIKPVKSQGRLLAFASITIDDCFAVHNLKVISGRDGLFVAMPSRRLLDGSHKDIAHPVNNKTREEIEKRVLEEYESCARKGLVVPPKSVAKEPGREEDAEKTSEPEVDDTDLGEDVVGDEDDDSFWATL